MTDIIGAFDKPEPAEESVACAICGIGDVALTRHLIVKIIGIFAIEMSCQSDIGENRNCTLRSEHVDRR